MGGRRCIVLAVDAGGSTTRCMLARGDGSVLGRGRGGPANHILCGWETACASFREATAAALQAAGRSAERIDVAVVGSAGVGPNGEGREVVESLMAELVPQAAAVRVTGDMVTAFWGALRTPVGVVVSAGTGSVCFGRNVTGRTCQVGGWGPVMGDEGSAYDIGRRALQAVARAADGRGEATALTELLAGALGGSTALELAIRVYGEPLGREQIAALAVYAVAAAQRGDAAAVRILRRAGDELGHAAVTALRGLQLLDVDAVVSHAGSVFDAGDWVCGPFAQVVRMAAPQARIDRPLLPPVGGAFRLGLEALGKAAADAVIERLRDGLAGDGP